MTKQPTRKSTAPNAGVQPAVPHFDPETQREMVVPSNAAIFPPDGPARIKLELDENNVLRRAAPTPDEAIRLTLPRAIVEKILGGMMSRASMRAYGSTWITGTETSLDIIAGTIALNTPNAVGQPWGQTVITPEEGLALYTLAQALGYWVKPNAEGVYRPFKGKE